ncbi:MAG: Mov34/MPN/PAD-1 family protein [Thermodesulfovibrionales bacterium]
MNAKTIWLDREHLRVLCEEANDKYPNETGGCFVGYYFKKNKDLVVTNIVGPGPNAIHGEYYFKPDDDWQEKEIGKLYSESGRLYTYLGDWHVHTVPDEKLSWKDKKTLRRIARHTPARIITPIMGIMYLTENWNLAIWQLKKMSTVSFYDNGVYKKLDLRFF